MALIKSTLKTCRYNIIGPAAVIPEPGIGRADTAGERWSRLKPDISIVIPAWNEEGYISDTLRAVSRATEALAAAGRAAEVIVVDNASTDRTCQRARDFPVRLVHHQERRIAAVRNAGARAADAGIFAFLDADSHPSRNAFVRICETLSGDRCVGGGVRIRPEKWTPASVTAYGLLPAVTWFLGVSAGLIFATREAFDAVGGFDETLYAAEDLEFVLALKRHARECGKKLANLTDVYITTSTRKLRKARARDFLVFPKYLFSRNAARVRENCSLWYDGHYR